MTKAKLIELFSKVVNDKTCVYQQFNDFQIELREKGIIRKNEAFTAANLKTSLAKLGVNI